MNYIVKLLRQKEKDSIFIIKNQMSEAVYLKVITERKKTERV